ncbi:MAG: hypothetical protein M0Z56_11790 [Desulfobacteraceae bacterium]|nr:hypothetical protein [Desulfobacteraceae bacterium]
MIKTLHIILPDDHAIRDKLKKKITEYETRVSKLKKQPNLYNPELSYNSIPGFKALIARRLYQRGEIETMEMAKELTEEYGRLDSDKFNVAASVINDYCITGGKKVKKGTGF